MLYYPIQLYTMEQGASKARIDRKTIDLEVLVASGVYKHGYKYGHLYLCGQNGGCCAKIIKLNREGSGSVASRKTPI